MRNKGERDQIGYLLAEREIVAQFDPLPRLVTDSNGFGGPFTRDELDTSVPFIARRCLAGEPGLALLDRVLADLLELEPPRTRQRKAIDLERLRVALSAVLANLIAARRPPGEHRASAVSR